VDLVIIIIFLVFASAYIGGDIYSVSY